MALIAALMRVRRAMCRSSKVHRLVAGGVAGSSSAVGGGGVLGVGLPLGVLVGPGSECPVLAGAGRIVVCQMLRGPGHDSSLL